MKSLIELCRVLRHNLSAGLTLRHVFRQQAERGPRPVRPVADRISQQIEQGESLAAALKREKDYFPPLFISLAIVGEQSGSLPEVLTELEKYYVLQQKLKRDFMSQIAWPAIQFFLAPLVIAGMIFVLGILSPPGGSKPFDPLGFGLTGTAGAILFLVYFFGTFAAFIGLYFVLTRTLKQMVAVHELVLRLPVIGPTVHAIVLMRFCLALRVTTETGMSIATAMRLSMRATGNAAVARRADIVTESLKSGDDLTVALTKAGIFPQDFLDIMANAEEGGRLAEVMLHQGEYYEEEARRRMTILTRVASWGVYFAVAAMLMFMIFRIASSVIGVNDPSRYGL